MQRYIYDFKGVNGNKRRVLSWTNKNESDRGKFNGNKTIG